MVLGFFRYGIAVIVIVVGVAAVIGFMLFMRVRAVRQVRSLGGDKHCVFCGEPLPTHMFHIEPVCPKCGRDQPWADKHDEISSSEKMPPV